MELKADIRTLPLLNDDVVLEIFKFLSLPERKNARLVCEQWHRVSNRRIFAEKEAFFIANMYTFRSVVDVLVKCKREILNLKFDQRIFDPSSNILWKKCGRRIQSLRFYVCSFPPDIVKRIFIHCSNLTEFSSQGGGVDGFYYRNETLPRQKSILQISKDVVRSKLRTLRLDSRALALRECDLRLIASAFPQLKSLKIQLFLSEDEEIRDSSNFTVLLNLLDTGLKNLENLNVDFPFSYEVEPIDFTYVSQFNLDRLKNVSMPLRLFILEGDSLSKILHYKFWRSLNISWSYWYESDITVAIRLLNENPLLEKVNVPATFETVSEFCDLFKVLVRSRLKSLRISTSDSAMPLEIAKLFIAEVTSSLEGLPCNDTVEHLHVRSERSAEFCSLFLKYFRNVRHLDAHPGNVNAIFKNQPHLKSLTIQPIGAIRTDEPPARTSIESLELIEIQPLALDMFVTYQFPNLKYLVINESKTYYDSVRKYDGGEELFGPAVRDVNEENGSVEVNQNDSKGEESNDTNNFIPRMNTLMSSISQKSPNLEAIQFDCDFRLDAEAFSLFFQSCLGFHQLRYVSFFSYSPQIDIVAMECEVAEYFKKCPSFRALWLRTLRFSLNFYYDILTKKYEFSNVFYSANSSQREYFHFGVNLPKYWRRKR